jgi:hypothetical protein
MVDQATAAKFKFGAKEASYSTGATGSSANNGVIGMMVYSEKQKPIPYLYGMRDESLSPFPIAKFYNGNPSGSTGNIQQVFTSNMISVSLNNVGAPLVSGSNTSMLRGAASAAPTTDVYSKGLDVQEQSVQNIGTEFGEATKFDTVNVEFERKDMVGMFVIYYDDLRGLRSRGLNIPSKNARSRTTPDAFPGMVKGCEPPENWSK